MNDLVIAPVNTRYLLFILLIYVCNPDTGLTVLGQKCLVFITILYVCTVK